MESDGHTASNVWSVPQCPFTIQYSARVLDDIRLAVMDAFFSLPRGGAEIGGVLLGRYRDGRVLVSDYEPLDCEHAFGPGFTLSDRDKAKLVELVSAERPPNMQVVGWYHSHTRSEIFLTDADQEIHANYFREPWQIALVIKPHTFQPARGGFFFREADGTIHGSSSYQEFYLQPLTVRPVPAGGIPAVGQEASTPPQAAPLRVDPVETGRPAITVTAEPVIEAAAPPEPEVEPVTVLEDDGIGREEPLAAAVPAEAPPEEPLPRREIFAEEPPRAPDLQPFEKAEEKPRRWPKVLVSILAGIAIGVGGYVTRSAWLSPVLAGVQGLRGGPAGSASVAALDLNATDSNGQLQIRWNRNSAPVRTGSNALLEIVDSGGQPRAIPLDEAHLRSGFFTYARQGERVDVALSMDQPNGRRAREGTTFLGKVPDRGEGDAALRKQRDDLTRENAKLQSDLKAAQERNAKLERSLNDATKRLREQQQRRLKNQAAK